MPTGTDCAGRGARRKPNDVDPGAIRGVLANTFVLDFDARRGVSNSAAQRANALFVKEPRGFSFLELWRSADREELDSILHCVADEAQALLIGAEARLPNLDAADVEIVLMPLRHHRLTHARSRRPCGSCHACHGIQRLSGVGPVALTSLRALDPPTRERLKPEDAGACRVLDPRYGEALQTFVRLFRRSTRDLTFRHAKRVRAP